ncbi:unnamed protein product, partial [marine sediment metagenome]
LSVDYYNRYTYDIIARIPVPVTYGDSAPYSNDAEMSNKGWEILLSHHHSLFNDFNYTIGGNLTLNKNNVEKYSTPAVTGSETWGYTIYEEGYEWGAYYGYEWTGGFFNNTTEIDAQPTQVGTPEKPGDLKFVDQNNDGVIDADDRIAIGTRTPNIIYGFNVGFDYKGFDFYSFFQGTADVHTYMLWTIAWPFNNYTWQPIYDDQLDYWTPQNMDASSPRLSVEQNVHNRVTSTYTVRKASYLRLKHVEIG